MGADAVAIILGAKLARRSNDTDYPFRQDSDFRYLTGYDHPNAVALLRTDGGPEFTLYVEPRDPDAERWTGHRPGTDGAISDYGADEAFAREEFLRHVATFTGKARRLYHVLGRDEAIDSKLTSSLEEMRIRSRQGLVPADAIFDPRAILHEMRVHKEPAELEIMRRAAVISQHAHAAAARLAREGAYEYELQAAIEYEFRRRGAAGPAYTTIVGGGANATILHYIVNDQPLRDGELVLIDAGCELEGYASDVTRTYPVGGTFVGEARSVYEVVLAAQQAALDRCKPGSTLTDVHDAAVRRIAEGLVDLKLVTGSVDEVIANETYRSYYMHNTSHWLGLDVHDSGAYRIDGEARTLADGMVFTVEPGLYISADDERVPAGFRGIGVRIEDDVAMTADGYENLTADIPRRPDEVENLIHGS